MTPVLLQFKDNVVVRVGAVETASEETEAVLRGEGGTTDNSGRPERPSDPNG